jgi:predicted RNase H-like nuclease (RuvC/YqgF family)
MEFTLDSIMSIGGLLLGGSGVGAFFTWRWVRRKAAAEAKSAEIDMAQKVQDTYQEMLEAKNKEVEDNHRLIAELREDRDHYKQGYIEMREALDKLGREFRNFRNETEEERSQMKRDIARNGRQIETMRPLLCGRRGCADRLPVTLSAEGEVKPKKSKKEEKTNGTV